MGKPRGRRDKRKENLGEGIEEILANNTKEATPFFGLLDSTELEYFKQAESTLNINAFSSSEEREYFVAGVYEESKGKELKLVTNQICSKLVERLVLVATERQMRQLFSAFNGHFVQLCCQKYSSHVMETYLVRMAMYVEKQMTCEPEEPDADEEYVSMENMLLFLLTEIKPQLDNLIVHRYASHVLRVILLILGGKQLPSTVESNSVLRSKKSKIARKMIDIKDNEDYKRSYMTPSSFKDELADILRLVNEQHNTKSLRELAIDKIGSPVIQLLIQLEGIVDKDRTLWCKTFNVVSHEKDPKEEAFVEYLLSDAVGSHFLETVISTQRHKNVERLFQCYMKERVLKLAKRETTGAYVIRALLKKLKPADQKFLLDELVPHLNELIVNGFDFGQSIMDTSQERGDYLKPEIVEKLVQFFRLGENSDIFESVLRLSTSTLGNTRDDWPTADERRRALFLEKVVAYDSKFLQECVDALIAMEPDRLKAMCKHGVFSHVVEKCLSKDVDTIRRKKLLNKLTEIIAELACHATGSHIVDCLWEFTFGLNMYKDRIAKILSDNRELLKNSGYGRQVWKNWHMELYSRRYADWKRIIKDELVRNQEPEEETKHKPKSR
ncbi:uncharacterized protein OGAPODRAFT_100043 [Ogataea polymorpha]|uniref:uncharacterized protein n=1 Tax=Ogataea polymorpha TaxID=460523 RepID=UPI0007F39A88|nr:uncharacterized protein OGAPODRAFT_100043 [Ogataea polymorpha]KAG7931704.1 hypothetical protein KL934_004116 [Ogataea polymorpha]OBA15433.1 hypothetical protein OGAPODRAFT_100043 [Ogataea polymorpha]